MFAILTALSTWRTIAVLVARRQLKQRTQAGPRAAGDGQDHNSQLLILVTGIGTGISRVWCDSDPNGLYGTVGKPWTTVIYLIGEMMFFFGLGFLNRSFMWIHVR